MAAANPRSRKTLEASHSPFPTQPAAAPLLRLLLRRLLLLLSLPRRSGKLLLRRPRNPNLTPPPNPTPIPDLRPRMGAMVAAASAASASPDELLLRTKRKFRPADPKPPSPPPSAAAAAWTPSTDAPLHQIALQTLDTIYTTAINLVTSAGYPEPLATAAVLASGHCNGAKDPASNIADNALRFLSTQPHDVVTEGLADAMLELKRRVLENMVQVVREVRPGFTAGDAVWCLLICDMNLPDACTVDVDRLEGNPHTEAEAETPLPDNAELTSLCSRLVSACNTMRGEDPAGELSSKPGRRGKGLARRDYIFQQRGNNNYYRGSRSKSFMTTVHTLSDLDKKFKMLAKSSKNSLCKPGKTVRMDASVGDMTSNISFVATTTSSSSSGRKMRSTTFTLDISTTEFPLFPPPKSSVTEPVSRPAPKQCYKAKCNPEGSSSGYSHRSSIQFDKIWGQVIPEEKKDEMLLKLASVVQELEAQLNGWTEWAEKKVMQAAHRLSKDKAELHTLRHEKDGVSRLYSEKQTLEENTVKMLTDMENALSKATGQVVKANKDVHILGVVNSKLKQELQDAKSLADKSAAACEEFSLREMAAPKKFQAGDREKAMLNEELATEKRELLRLKNQLEQANEHLRQLEVRWRQEEKVKEEALTHAKIERKSREHNEVSAKLKEDAVKAKAESDLERCQDDIRRLKHEIAELKMMEDSKMAALKQGMDSNTQVSSELLDQVESGSGELHRDRECVVCLTEERSVVFLPCAHQVVCTNCNQIHKEQGVRDCPSCRTPIQRRIRVKST